MENNNIVNRFNELLKDENKREGWNDVKKSSATKISGEEADQFSLKVNITRTDNGEQHLDTDFKSVVMVGLKKEEDGFEASAAIFGAYSVPAIVATIESLDKVRDQLIEHLASATVSGLMQKFGMGEE